MQPLLWLTSLLVAASVRGDPTVTVKNGTYAGVSVPSLKQDIFLGMPFAQQPVPPLLRLRPPLSLNTSWHGVRDAKAYSPICYGYDIGTSTEDAGYELSEACLTINVIRPAGVKVGTKVPVVAWIYGGGFFVGGSSDPRFNGSWIVEKSVEMGKPIIFASFNYRLTAFGFLYSKEVRAEKMGNFGLFDQRLALRWIHENIGAFGGDPTKVTIMGESAGAVSVAMNLLYEGQTLTNLFRAAILESGTMPPTAIKSASAYQPSYDAIVNSTGCAGASDSLACLRSLPVDQFVAATNRSVYSWGPVVDGVFLPDEPHRLFASGKHVRVPLIIGQNTDEGATFGPKSLNTSTDIGNVLKQSYPLLSNTSIDKILELYPDDPFYGCPFNTGDALLPSGRQDKRGNAIIGDLYMHAGRRQVAQIMSRTNAVYSYRFDQPPDNATILEGTGHFQEVAYVFSNPLPTQNTLSQRPGDAELAAYMTSAWVSFVHSQNPNHGQTGVQWTDYRKGAKNVVFRRHGNFVEDDDYRKAGIAYINSIREQLQN